MGHGEGNKKWGQAGSNICTLCNLSVETHDHVLKCKHVELVKVRYHSQEKPRNM